MLAVVEAPDAETDPEVPDDEALDAEALDAEEVHACCSACISVLPKLAAPWAAAAAKGLLLAIWLAQTEGFKTLEMDIGFRLLELFSANGQGTR